MKTKKSPPLVSIIVLNYNGKHFLKGCLPTIKAQTYPKIETIVVDNNSTDGSQQYVSKIKDVILIKNKENFGYARANNIAAKQAKGEFVLFLNNDTELFTDAIEKLINCYVPKSLVAPAQIFSINKKTDKVGFSGAGMDLFGYGYVNKEPSKTRTFYVDGAAIFMRRADFIKIGMFDDELFIFHEDIDLSWRAQIMGYKLVRCWDAKLYHYSGGVVPGGGKVQPGFVYKTSLFRIFLNQKNVIRNIIKNYSLPFLSIILPVLIAIHTIEIIVLSLLGKWPVVKCYLRAYIWNITHIRSTLDMRSKIQKHRIVSDITLIRKMYIAYSKLTALIRIGLPEFI